MMKKKGSQSEIITQVIEKEDFSVIIINQKIQKEKF